MKRKTLTLTLCLLACFAVISVGFAAWIITNDAREEVTGNIQVDTVTDSRLSIEIDSEAGSTITFGKPEGYADGGWLINDDETTEVLTATIVFKVKKGNDYVAFDAQGTEKIAVSATFASNITTEENKGVENKTLITLPQEALTVVKGEAENTYKIVLEFGYGETFGKVNPYNFYKDKEVNTDGDNALANLQKLYSLNAKTYTVTISAQNVK